MGNDLCLLITLLYEANKTLLRVALKLDRDEISEDCAKYFLEPENRASIHALLPAHVRSLGPIVEIEELFEVHQSNPTGQGRADCGAYPAPGCSTPNG
jgi:hypothetical protein